jgi:hypothetical protein
VRIKPGKDDRFRKPGSWLAKRTLAPCAVGGRGPRRHKRRSAVGRTRGHQGAGFQPSSFRSRQVSSKMSCGIFNAPVAGQWRSRRPACGLQRIAADAPDHACALQVTGVYDNLMRLLAEL